MHKAQALSPLTSQVWHLECGGRRIKNLKSSYITGLRPALDTQGHVLQEYGAVGGERKKAKGDWGRGREECQTDLAVFNDMVLRTKGG